MEGRGGGADISFRNWSEIRHRFGHSDEQSGLTGKELEVKA